MKNGFGSPESIHQGKRIENVRPDNINRQPLKAFLSVENLRPDLIQAQSRVAITMTETETAA